MLAPLFARPKDRHKVATVKADYEASTMAPPPRRRDLSAEERRALEMLNRSPRSGCTNRLLVAHGFTLATLVGLIRDGLVHVQSESLTAPGRTVEIVRVRITAAGRRAIKGE
jgi:hypothetical protein